jgi:predicted Zn-dependent protease with MMP-like domain
VDGLHVRILTLDRVRDILRSAATAAFVVGLLLVMVNPPSLSGAEDLLSLIAGALALMLLTAWATVALMERDTMTEQEFERLVERSERLANQPEQALAESEFELLVAEAIDDLPQEFREALEQVPVVVSNLGAEHRAYGHYYGDGVARDNFEDRIVIYQDTLERDFGHDPDLLRAQVTRTLRHEVAHHLGWGERGVRELGL